MSELEPNVELESAGTGADAVPVAGDGAGEAAVVSQPDAEPIAGEGEEPQEIDLSQIDLTTLPQYREVQSSYDRQFQALRQRAEQAELRAVQQQRQLEQQMGEIRMRDATPDERATYYRTQLAKQQADFAQQQRQQQEMARLQGQAGQLLTDLGLKLDTPGLDWSGGVTSEGLTRLAASAARLIADRGTKRQGEAAQVAKQTQKKATQNAVRATGASKANLATGSSNRSQAAQFREDMKKLPRGRGGRPPSQREIIALKAKYRKAGYDPDKENYMQ